MHSLLCLVKNVLLLHGGAGSDKSLSSILKIYSDESNKKSDALSAVVSAVSMMEDDPMFNAGTGSVQRIDGTIQMDAAVMTEDSLGSVMNIESVRNPVEVARAVMEKSPHVILCGDGAVNFARVMGFKEYDPNTEKAEQNRKKVLEMLFGDSSQSDERYTKFLKVPDLRHLAKYSSDTVGAVCRKNGEFAAAVSTGGAVPMLRGRVGDSPVPGSGIFVGEKGAVVATGIGEDIIKRSLCFKVYERIGSEDLKDILDSEVETFGDVSVGIIAVDSEQDAYSSNRNMAVATSR